MPPFSEPIGLDTTKKIIPKYKDTILVGFPGAGKTLISSTFLYPGETCPDGRLARNLMITFDEGQATVSNRYGKDIVVLPYKYDIRYGTKQWREKYGNRNPFEEIVAMLTSIGNNSTIKVGATQIDMSQFKVIIFDGIHVLSQLIDDVVLCEFQLTDYNPTLNTGAGKNAMSHYLNTRNYQMDIFSKKLKYLPKYCVSTCGLKEKDIYDKDSGQLVRIDTNINLVGSIKDSIGHDPDCLFVLEEDGLSKKFKLTTRLHRKLDTKMRPNDEYAKIIPSELFDTFKDGNMNIKLYVIRHALLFGEWRPDITWQKLTQEQRDLINSDPVLYGIDNSQPVQAQQSAQTKVQPVAQQPKPQGVKPQDFSKAIANIRNFKKKGEVAEKLEDANAKQMGKFLEGESDMATLTQDEVMDIVNGNTDEKGKDEELTLNE